MHLHVPSVSRGINFGSNLYLIVPVQAVKALKKLCGSADSSELSQAALLYIVPDKKNFMTSKNVIISLSINLNMCFGCSKEPSH